MFDKYSHHNTRVCVFPALKINGNVKALTMLVQLR